MLNIEKFADSNELFDGHYVLIRPLSVDGATADVWLALDTNTVTGEVNASEVVRLPDAEIEKLGLMVAIKIYRPQNALDIEGEQKFRDEYMIVFNCHHTNLIHPTHFSIFKETPYLVLPYCKLGSSELLIGNKFEKESVWKFILDVSSGLAYLHALKPPIIHQDIKPANILLDDTHHYAITDFGISSQNGGVHGHYYDEENSGTLAYMAPERFKEGCEPIPQSDIWAFGATLYEILTGRVPYGEQGGKNQMKANVPIPKIPGVSADIQRLIQACLAKEPGDRPTASQIVEAARAKRYPIKSKKYLFGGLAAFFAVLIGCAAFFMFNQEKNLPIKSSDEEQFAIALNMVNSDNVDTLKAGMELMEGLSNNNYIPAIYQMAYTYGWYSDSVSVKRKKMLGIEMEKNYIPVSDKYSHKAIGLFSKIQELNDSSFATINAKAMYRLACYYIEENDIQVKDYSKGKKLLLKAKEWEGISNGDPDLLERINRGLATIYEYEKANKKQL